jgi:hypothetical protein
MPKVTQDNALKIAKAFSGFANAVDDYRFAHFTTLDDLQQANLLSLAGTLRATSNNFLNFGINLALDNVQHSLDQLGQVTTLINDDLKVLADIGKAVEVIGVLAGLGTAFATGNPIGIATALQGAIKDLTVAAGQSDEPMARPAGARPSVFNA